jgi:hypothetical protein
VKEELPDLALRLMAAAACSDIEGLDKIAKEADHLGSRGKRIATRIRKFTAANRLVQSEWAKLHDLVKKRVPE